jgi:gliding motility-associated-like protein
MRLVKFLVLLTVLITVSFTSLAQTKRANVWHFRYAALDFNYGTPPNPIPKFDIPGWGGTTSVSDTNGNLLFCCDGDKVFNKNGFIMQGGVFSGYSWGTNCQHVLAFPMPGSERFYYLFTTHNSSTPESMEYRYSLIDMQANNGLGKVCDSVKEIHLVGNVTHVIHGVHHANKRDVWVITHGNFDNSIYAHLITPDGIIGPVTSYAGGNRHWVDNILKLSPDGSKLAIRSSEPIGNQYTTKVQILTFNNQNGEVSEAGMVEIPLRIAGNSGYNKGFEFSPDGSKFYLSDYRLLLQFDLDAGTPEQIIASRYSYELDTIHEVPTEMEYICGIVISGPDGKVYIDAGDGAIPSTSGGRLSVVHNPNLPGAASNFIENDLYLGGNVSGAGHNLPNFLADWLKDPVIKADNFCSNTPVNFSLDLNGSIDSVFWKFNDFWNIPNDTSTALSPLYSFSRPGTYNITAEIHFGNLQKTIPYRITITPTPIPNLGNDTILCPNDPINLTLYAGPGEQYNWNNNFPTNESTFIVADTGTYWVRVNDHGCFGRDTIIVSRYEEATIDLTSLDITPSNCGSSDGAITGIQFTAPDPFTVTWLDIYGNQAGSGNDLINVSAGSYSAEVTFGNNCIQTFGPYPIADNNAPVIASALPGDDDHCYQGMGSIIVTPESGSVSDYQYSFNEMDYYPLSVEITGLTANTYNITLKDQFGCISLPVSVEVQNIEGPQIYCHPTHATGADNGMITVDSPNTNLTYRLNFGPVQTTNVFTGLAAGSYTVYVTDEFGCETQCEITIENNPGIPLSAMAGDDKKCLNELANSNIRVSGVSGVKEFTASLAFDGQKLQCIHFNDSLPGIISTVYPGTSRVVLEWNGTVPLTTNDTISLGELVFETLESGFADINWDSPPVTRFIDENGNVIFPHLTPEAITIHDLPAIELNQKITYCQGESIHLIPFITGGAEPMTGQWNTPDGSTTHQNINIASAAVNHSGQYTYSVKDYFGCADTLTKEISVFPLPTVNLPFTNPTHDTIYYEQTFQLETTPGYASYQWNTGDTTYYITITEEGSYSVIVQTNEGCTSTNSAYLKDMYMPFYFNVPNAFTPNNDGLNDTFRPVATGDLIRQFSMVIYNRWGQMIFETSDYSAGWDGKGAPAGVYSWLISYSNHLGKVFKMRGSVMLVK